MRTINLADVSPKRRYTAYPKYPKISNGIIDKLIELIENGESFKQTVLCEINGKFTCTVSRYPIDFETTIQSLEEDFEGADNPVFIDIENLNLQIFRWNNIYYYLTY